MRGRATVAALLGAAVLSGCGGGESERPAPAASGWTVLHDGRRGLTVRFPSTWHRATRSLTPALVDPVEILSLGTFRLRPRQADAGCAQFPGAALRAAGPRDVFLSVQERTFGGISAFSPRPAHVRLGRTDESEAIACRHGPRPWRSYWLSFRDRGRGFYVLALVGRQASDARRRELRQVLDGLRFIDPRHRFAAGRGITGALPGGWHLIREPLAAAVSARDQIAAASYPVPVERPDRNCTPTAALRALPDDGAFVYGFEYEDPSPAQLARLPRRPARSALDPDSRQPYECMGVSYLIRFRARRRAFQFHVYLGPRAGEHRRRQALAFVDGLAIERRGR